MIIISVQLWEFLRLNVNTVPPSAPAASPNAGIIMTQAGNLQCKKIIHVVGQANKSLIQNIVKSVLQKCEANSYTSVSFPAIGTGEFHQQGVGAC